MQYIEPFVSPVPWEGIGRRLALGGACDGPWLAPGFLGFVGDDLVVVSALGVRRRRRGLCDVIAAVRSSPAPTTCSPTPAAPVRPANREVAKPRARSHFRMSRPRRAR